MNTIKIQQNSTGLTESKTSIFKHLFRSTCTMTYSKTTKLDCFFLHTNKILAIRKS